MWARAPHIFLLIICGVIGDFDLVDQEPTGSHQMKVSPILTILNYAISIIIGKARKGDFMNIFNREICFSTFFKKGLPVIDDSYGCYFVSGKQGSGKSYFAVFFLLRQYNKNIKHKIKVKTNIKSLKLDEKLYDVEYFTDIRTLYTDTEEYVIFVIDEISRKYDKNSKTDTQFYAWLNQSRKRHRIVFMITQEWKELPMWIRRPAKFCFYTKPTPLFHYFGIYTTFVGDAENMYLDKDTMEWECPIIKKYYYKRNLYIANMYDTFEAINQL